MMISPFVRCPAPCGKIHVVLPSISRKIVCPWCNIDLVDLLVRGAK